MQTPLYSALAELFPSLRAAEYRGAETASQFEGPASEYLALTHGCGIYDLGWRSKLAVRGEDRSRWLNGMLTNNIKDLAVDCGVYCFLLNAQGRIQADMYVYNRDDHFLADTDAAQFDKMCGTFEKFIIMDDVELAAVADVTAIGVRGPKAREVFQRANISFAERICSLVLSFIIFPSRKVMVR